MRLLLETALVSAGLCAAFALATPAGAAEMTTRFTGEPSCASSSCHGGGTGKDQCLTWEKMDFHTRAPAILAVKRSQRIAETLGIADATKDARCTICHNPLQSLPAARFASAKPEVRDQGVSCETCHGPAETWLRFHTRLDLSHEQRIGAGMREMRDLYDRANVCVACHLNVDPTLVKAGHPEMFFELDGQMHDQPPHWKEKENDAWLGPRAWLTGQAVDLRELGWKLAAAPADENLQARVMELFWLLGQAPDPCPLHDASAENPKSVQTAADRLARIVNHEAWTHDSTAGFLKKLAQTNETFRDATVAPADQRRRAEVLLLALDRLWTAR